MLSTSTFSATLSRVTSAPYHHGNLRSALLEQAERTVEARGASALSLRELAREVGVSHAAPRRHFPGRQALFDALGETGFERLGDDLARAAEDAGKSFDARLHALAQTYVAFATRHAVLVELMFAGKHRVGADRLRQSADRAVATPLRVIAEAQASGELPDGDPGRIATAVFATMNGLATMVNSGMIEAGQVQAVVTDTTDLLLGGLHEGVGPS